VRLPKDRIIHLAAQVDQSTMNHVASKIIEINKDDRDLEKLFEISGQKYDRLPIELYIDSYGGYVYQCFGLLGVMERSTTPVHTIVTGAAMSCGFMILISGHKRFALKYATPMYHQVSTWKSGTVQEVKEDMVETERLQSIVEEITIRKTTISQERLKEVREKKLDWYMSPDEALRLKVVDEIMI
jgi:ATP-dependent Clp protease protease subunit